MCEAELLAPLRATDGSQRAPQPEPSVSVSGRGDELLPIHATLGRRPNLPSFRALRNGFVASAHQDCSFNATGPRNFVSDHQAVWGSHGKCLSEAFSACLSRLLSSIPSP